MDASTKSGILCARCGTELVPGAAYCHACGKAVSRQPARHKRGNGQGTARKRGRTWTGYAAGYSYVDADGVPHRVRPSKGGFRIKAEALAWAAQGSGGAERPVPRFIDLWQGYESSDFKRLSSSKQTAYRIAQGKLKALMGRTVDSVTLDDLQAAVDSACPTYYPARDCKQVLSHLYDRAIADNGPTGRITKNLARYIVLPPLEEQEAVPFTQAELERLWALYDGDGDLTAARILLMTYTGLMPAELLACTVDMVDLERREIRGAGAKTKVRKAAAVAWPEFLDPVVSALVQGSATGRLVDTSKWPFYAAFYDALDRAGIDNPVDVKGRHRLTPYSCRHTYGTEAVKAGLHPEMIKKMLRHSSTRMQERYTHIADAELHAAVQSIKK